MGLPVLVPYSPPEGGEALRWLPVYVDDLRKYGIDAVLQAVQKIGNNGLLLHIDGDDDDDGGAYSSLIDVLHTALLSILSH